MNIDENLREGAKSMKEKLVKSQHLQTVSVGEMNIVWHSLFGYPQIMNKEAIELLNIFVSPNTIEGVAENNEFNDIENYLQILQNCRFLTPINLNERKYLEKKTQEYAMAAQEGKAIDYLSLIVSENCNFACKYCISNSMIAATERKDNKIKMMSIKTALRAIDIFLSILKMNGKNEAYINFGGGEPLLNYKTIKSVLSYCRKRHEKGFRFKFRINTNASLVTPEVANLFKIYDIKPAISLDGLKEANDKVRITPTGNGTFDRILGGIDNLERASYPTKGFSVTLTEENFGLIDETLIEFAERRNFIDIRIDLDVIHLLPVPPELAVKKLMSLKREAESRGLHVSGFWERPVENLNNSILDKHIAFCGGVAGKSMCVSPSEEVFICGYSGEKLAILSKEEFLHSERYHRIVTERLAGRIKRCIGCPIEGQCIGGCFITEEFNSLKKEAALNYNCELYRRMTIELLKDSLKNAVSESNFFGAERR